MSMSANAEPSASGESTGCGDLLLQFSNGGERRVYSQVLILASPVFRDALTSSKIEGRIKVDGSKDAWDCILKRLYPVYPRPKLTVDTCGLILPIAHKYNMPSIIAKIMAFLNAIFPADLTPDPKSPCYVIRWLTLADELQMDELHKTCMLRIRELAHSKQLEKAVLADMQPLGTLSFGCFGLPGAATPSKPKPLTCPQNHGAALKCLAWCRYCGMWTCTLQTPFSSSFGSAGSICSTCRQAIQPVAPARWFSNDQPLLLEDIKKLSRSTLEEMLASTIMVTSGDYSSQPRQPAQQLLGSSTSANQTQALVPAPVPFGFQSNH